VFSYALHFLEAVNTAASQESIQAMNEEADTRAQEWELENIKRMKEEEEERMSEEEDQLFYEVVS
jgi:membrane protein YdbS with pleckstrin-like domain